MRNRPNQNELRRTAKPLWRYGNRIFGGMGTGRMKIRNPLLYPAELRAQNFVKKTLTINHVERQNDDLQSHLHTGRILCYHRAKLKAIL